MANIKYEKYYDASGVKYYRAVDVDTGQYVSEPLRNAYDIGREFAAGKKLSQENYTSFQRKLDSTERRQGIIDAEITEYLRTGRSPKHSFVQSLLWRIEQDFPKNKGWVLQRTSPTSYNGYYVGTGLAVQNKFTQETAIIDTHQLGPNKHFSDSYMHFVKHAYMNNYPQAKIHGVYTYDAGLHNIRYSTPYSFYKGQPSPKGLHDIYSIGRGFFGQKRNLDEEAYRNASLDTSNGLFPKGSRNTRYKKVFTVFDTETEDTFIPGAIGKPVEVNAKKFGLTYDGKIELIDTFERYYQGLFRGSAAATHGYNRKIIKKLQGLTNQKIGQVWSEDERNAFLDFLEGPILGHNIENFDFQSLRLSYKQIEELHKYHGVIDTLQLARNLRDSDNPLSPRPKNALQELFQEFFGQSTESFGIRAHGAGGDVTANTLLIQEWMSSNTDMGKVLKAVLTSPLIMNLYTASKGKSTDALGQMFYDNKGNEYTAEEVMWMSGANNPTNQSIDTNVIGVLQQLTNAIGTMSSAVVASMNELKGAKSASETEYRNLSTTLAATHTGQIENLVKDARRLLPDDYELQQEYVSNAAFPESIRKGALNQLDVLHKDDIKKAQEHFTSSDFDELQAKWNFEENKGVIDAYNAAKKNPMAYWDAEGNYQVGERYAKIENGWVDRIDASRERQRQVNGLYDDAQKGNWSTDYLQAQIAKLPQEGLSDKQLVSKALNESVVLPAFKQDDKAWQQHLDNMKKESDLWQKIDKNAIQAAGNIGSAVIELMIPAAQRSAPFNEASNQMSSVMNSLSWMPSFVRAPMQRLTAAAQNGLSSWAAQLDFHQSQASAIGSAVSQIGGTAGGALMAANPIAGAAVSGLSQIGGSLISGIAGGGWKTKRQQLAITQLGQGLSNSFNLFGALFETVRAPMMLFNKALGIGVGLFTKFNKLMSLFNNLGLPYTGLTSVTYGYGERLALLDKGLGLQAGAVNSSYNTWAESQMSLYNMGHVDTNRLVASSLLGVFGDVYANGGDTTEQYARTVNKLANDMQTNPEQRQRIMGLAKQISPTMQSELAMLAALRSTKGYENITYERMMRGDTYGIHVTPDEDVGSIKGKNGYQGRFYAARFGLSAAKQESLFQMQRIGVSAWEKIGQPVSDALIKSLGDVVTYIENGDWEGAWKYVKTKMKEALSWAKGKLGIEDDTDWKEVIKDKLKAMGEWIAISIGPSFESIGETLIKAWGSIMKVLGSVVIDGLNEISQYQLDFKAILGRMGVSAFKEYENAPMIYKYGAYTEGASTYVSEPERKTAIKRLENDANVVFDLLTPKQQEALLDMYFTYGGNDNKKIFENPGFNAAVGMYQVQADQIDFKNTTPRSINTQTQTKSETGAPIDLGWGAYANVEFRKTKDGKPTVSYTGIKGTYGTEDNSRLGPFNNPLGMLGKTIGEAGKYQLERAQLPMLEKQALNEGIDAVQDMVSTWLHNSGVSLQNIVTIQDNKGRETGRVVQEYDSETGQTSTYSRGESINDYMISTTNSQLERIMDTQGAAQ